MIVNQVPSSKGIITKVPMTLEEQQLRFKAQEE
jgi:hypothetical protein